MLVIGYRGTPDWSKVKASIKRCLGFHATDIEKIVRTIRSGQSCQIPDDFVLHDELKDLGLILK
jgi:hypothetical protein